MKRFISAVLASLLLVSSAFAQVPEISQVHIPSVSRNLITVEKVQPTVLEQLYAMGGLTFFADYADGENGIDAEYALGNPMGIFTRTGTAYYVDHTGTYQLAAANTPRFTHGTYSESGWTLFDANGKLLKGLMIESAMTNRATYCNTPENAAWTKTNITADNDDATSTSPDGTATAPSLTASDANGTFTQAYTDASAGIYTASIFIKRKTGTGTINLRANTGNDYTDITANVKNYWTRIPVSSTSLTNPTFDLQIVTSGDAVYIWNPQLEKNPYMTSPIPSLTTAVARGAEVLTYPCLLNRTAIQETIHIAFTPFGTFANDGLNRILISNTGSARVLLKTTTETSPRLFPNLTDSSTSSAATDTVPVNNIKKVVSGVIKSSSPYVRIFDNSVFKNSSSTSFTTNTFGTNFYIGSGSSGTGQISGIIQNVILFSIPQSTSEISKVYGLI